MPVRVRCQPPKAAMFPSPETPSEPGSPQQEMTGSTKVRGAVSARTLQAVQPAGLGVEARLVKMDSVSQRAACQKLAAHSGRGSGRGYAQRAVPQEPSAIHHGNGFS